MSDGTKKRISKAVTIMSQGIKRRRVFNPLTGYQQWHTFSFCTLTISSSRNLTAREAYDSLFNHFLDWLTRTKGVTTYVWKGELQERGQMHYHLVFPDWIHYKEIRYKWNDLQRRAGLLDDYALEHGHFNPNSTDIHETHEVKKTANYIIKELAKALSAIQVKALAEVNEKIRTGEISEDMAELEKAEIIKQQISTIGKVWGCSQNLSGVGYFTLQLTNRHIDLIEQWIKEGKAKEKCDDYYALVICDDVDPPDLLCAAELKQMDTYFNWVFSRLETGAEKPIFDVVLN